MLSSALMLSSSLMLSSVVVLSFDPCAGTVVFQTLMVLFLPGLLSQVWVVRPAQVLGLRGSNYSNASYLLTVE